MAKKNRKASSDPDRWGIEDSSRLYGVNAWGRGYFSVNDLGHMCMGPTAPGGPVIDIKELVDEVAERGIGLPILIRFSDLLRERIRTINEAFGDAIKEYDYRGHYRGVYPIKVNQNRLLVQELVEYGRQFNHGLEAGSKPELLAVMAMLDNPDALVVCNGYKDEEYIETALLGSQLGPKIILVVEKPAEIALIHEVTRKTGIRPSIGMRARLSTARRRPLGSRRAATARSSA